MRRAFAAAILTTMSLYAAPSLAQNFGQRGAAAPQEEGGSRLETRVERLEEQLVDLQGVVAAVETLAKNSGGGTSGYAAVGGASGDQIRQLSEQIADLTQRIERLEARLGAPASGQPRSQSGAAPASGYDQNASLPPLSGAPPQGDRPPYGRSSSLPPLHEGGSADRQAAVPVEPKPSLPRLATTEPVGAGGAPQTGASSGSARALYDQAYGAFNRREYAAAQTYFEQFLREYPADPLAASAQYWLAEAAFVGGEYRSAADRFLKAFTNYPSSDKAPEALLKLAISLRRLGENSAACESFAELERRFPQAPKTVMKRAEAEKRRANCTS